MASIEIKKFTPSNARVWNDFVANAKNATFLFDRGYMDYHADRFTDHSLLLYGQGKIKAVFVANEVGDQIISHAGLSYGGLVLEKEARLEDVLALFFHLTKYYHELGFRQIVYKCLPSYYATHPSQEDLYAMFLLKADLLKRDTSSVLVKSSPLPYQQRRKKNVNEGKAVFQIVPNNDPLVFWEKALMPNLSDRFRAEPVHTAQEMKLLMDRFPDNIHLFEIKDENEIVGGTVIYSTASVAHAQYTSATRRGKELGALDVLFDHLITATFKEKEYVSFGTSNGELGNKLNRGLVNWKEGFGARTFAVDTYQVDTSHYFLLSDYA